MTQQDAPQTGKRERNMVFVWIAVVTGLILLVPAGAMYFFDEVNWTLTDFIIAAALIFGTTTLFVLLMRAVHTWRYRIVAAIIIAIAFIYLWAELAVGIFTDWGS